METKRAFFLILSVTLLVSCTPVASLPTSTPVSRQTSTPIITATLHPTESPTKVVPTNTPEVIQVSCPNVKSELPTNDSDGKVVLNGAYLVYDKSVGHYVLNPGSAFLWDIKNDEKTELLHEQNEELLGFSVSPDHKWLVYAGRMYDGSSDRVIVTDFNGKTIRNIDAYNWFFPLGWLDNQKLAIWMLSDVTDGPPFPTLIYNPHTRDSKLIMPDYPNISVWRSIAWSETMTVYDPTLSFVIYVTLPDPTGSGDVVLWNLEEQKEVVRLKHLYVLRNNNAPLWSPDGQEFIIDANLEGYPSFELYSINLQGEIQQLTHFDDLAGQQTVANLTLWNYSWSGDGRYIAFWYRIGDGKAAQLALLDTLNNNIKDLCIKSYWHFNPIWSPDNEQFLVDGLLNESETTNYQTLLVDINDNYVVKIAEDVLPEGWLLNEH